MAHGRVSFERAHPRCGRDAPWVAAEGTCRLPVSCCDQLRVTLVCSLSLANDAPLVPLPLPTLVTLPSRSPSLDAERVNDSRCGLIILDIGPAVMVCSAWLESGGIIFSLFLGRLLGGGGTVQTALGSGVEGPEHMVLYERGGSRIIHTRLRDLFTPQKSKDENDERRNEIDAPLVLKSIMCFFGTDIASVAT